MINSQNLKFNGISVVLPALNEEASIKSAVLDIVSYLNNLHLIFEIVVVNDGSQDMTAQIVEVLAKGDKRIRLVNHKISQGYGLSLRDGINVAGYDLIFFTDSDRQFDIKELDVMLPLMYTGVIDIVIGYRLGRKDSLLRRFLSWGYNTLVSFLFDLQIKDIDCAFKLLRREVFFKIKIESHKFFVNTEILAKARRLGFNILEVGVRHFPRVAGKSSVSLKYIPLTLIELCRIWKELKDMDKNTK